MTIKTSPARYQINTWGSHPDSNNDDWWTSADAGETLAAARASLAAFVGRADDCYFELVEIVGTRIDKVFGEVEVMERVAIRRNPAFIECPADADCGEWAMLQGMAHGVEAYNDAIGSSTR